MKFTHSDTSLYSKHCTLCRIAFTLPFIETLAQSEQTWTQNVECTNVERKIDPHCNTHKPPYRHTRVGTAQLYHWLADVVVHSTDSSSWNRSVNRWVTLSSSISYRCHCCDVIVLARALVLVRGQSRAGVVGHTRGLFNWHDRFIDNNCIQQCRNMTAVCMVLLLLLRGREV